MQEALEEESRKNYNAPISALVRQALAEWLNARGYDVQADAVEWGGARGRSEPDDETSGEVSAYVTSAA